MLSEKYIAGFLDADGYIGLQLPEGMTHPQLTLGFSQRYEQDKVLNLIQEAMGGSIRQVKVNEALYSNLTLCGSSARNCLNRITKYLVIKRFYASMCSQLANTRFDGSREDFRPLVKSYRRTRSLPLPNYPSRKWLAGYFDGDGCLSASVPCGQTASVLAHIACSSYDMEGIELIQKAFGGNIHDMRNGACRQYALPMAASKAKEFLGYFAKHLVVKKDQADLILKCAAMGHFRDGKNIKAALKHLKAHQHRLNDSGVDLGSVFGTIRDLKKPWSKNGLMACVQCGSDKSKHMGYGLCSACYQKNSRKRQSESAKAA